MLASKHKGTLYIGVTNNLVRRVYEHKNGIVGGFNKKYNVKKLLCFEQFDNIETAIQREKHLKSWHREWKIRLIEEMNHEWKDL